MWNINFAEARTARLAAFLLSFDFPCDFAHASSSMLCVAAGAEVKVSTKEKFHVYEF